MATTKVTKNIDFLVDEHGNLTGTRNPKSQTSADPNYADTALVVGRTNPLTGVVVNAIVNLTQAQYDAIVTKDTNTLYVIVG